MPRRFPTGLVARRPSGFAVPRLGIMAGMTGGATYGQGTVGYRMRGLRGAGTVRSQAYEESQYSRLADIYACRTAYRVNPIFRRIVNAEVENIVGTGFRVMPTSSDRDWNALVRAYLEDRYDAANFAFPNLPGRSEWGVHMLARFHQTREGGVFVYRSARGVQVFEEAQCGTPSTRQNDPLCRDGLQFNEDGTLQGYWIGDYSAIDGTRSETDMYLIPAFIEDERFGRLKCTSYIASGGWASGIRGIPPLACVIDDLERFADYYDVVSERAAAEANVVGVLKSDRQNTRQIFNVGRNGTATDSTVEADYSNPAYIEPSAVIKVKKDEDFRIEGLHTPGSTFEPYTKMSMRFVGAPMAMPIEILLLHFSDTNFSASKAAIEQYHTACRMAKRMDIEAFTVPNYRMAVYQGVLDGDVPYREDWWRASVVPSGWRSLEEAKETNAAIARIDAGVTTHVFEMARLYDRTPEDALREIVSTLDDIREAAAQSGYSEDLLRELFYSNPWGASGSKSAEARQAGEPPDGDTKP